MADDSSSSADDQSPVRSSKPETEPPSSSPGRLEVLADASKPEDASIQDVVFIPDLAQSSADTWNKVSITSRLKPHEFRTYVFDYKPTIRNDLESLVQFEKIEIHAQRLLEELRRIKTQRGEGPFAPRFVAHGYGGLVCESAYLLNRRQFDRVDLDGLILFGTPQFRAGLAQWALILAKKLGIPCADRPQQQDWSSLQKDLDLIAGMQTRFYNLNPGPKLACYFSMVPTKKPELMISPEWATIPGATFIPINSDHFGMTEFETHQFQDLYTLLKSDLSIRVGDEALWQYWNKSATRNSGLEVDDLAKVAQQLLFDPQEGPLTITDSVIEHTAGNEDDGIRSTEWLLEKFGNRITDEDISRLLKAAAANERHGKPILESLLNQYTGRIAIKEDIVQIASGNEKSGLQILNLLVTRDDSRIPVTQEAIEAAAKIGRDGLERLELLLKQCESAVAVTDKIVEAATSCESQRVEILALLISKGKIEVSLSWALEKEYDDVAELLLDRGEVDVNAQDKEGLTPLLKAVQGGRENSVRRLLRDTSIDVNLGDRAGGQTPLLLAVERNYSAIVDLLLEAAKIDVNKHGAHHPWTPLFLASQKGHMNIVRKLLDVGDIQPDLAVNNRQTPLSVAAEKGHETIVDLLLEKDGVEVDSTDKYGWTPLAYAVRYNKWDDITSRLLEAGADVQKVNVEGDVGRTPFLQAAARGAEDIVKLLLPTGQVDVDVRDAQGCTGFWWAASSGHVETMRLLLGTSKVNVRVRDYNNDQTPLLRAAKNGYRDCVELLLGRGEIGEEDIIARDKDGRTPFWWAAKNGHMEIMRLLGRRTKVDETMRDSNGHTPFESE